MQFKAPGSGILFKSSGQNNIPNILVHHHGPILIIYYSFRDTSIESKGLFVGLAHIKGGIGPVPEPNVFHPASGENDGKEAYLLSFSIGQSHVVMSKIDLGLLPVRQFLDGKIFPGYFDNRDVMFLADKHYEVIYRAGIGSRKFGMVFL